MLGTRRTLLGVAAAFALLTGAAPAGAEEPEVTAETSRGWVKTTHIIKLNRAAAIKLQDGLDRADTKLIGGALTAAAPHPALKIAGAVATSNADAFKRSLNKEGAIGPNGVTITLTTYVGKGLDTGDWKTIAGDLMNKDPLGLNRRATTAAEVALNPWSWEMARRD
jgi:hypothetical protein